ncbi:MAG: hypothetical protein L6R40_002783 [Gallowayella cf. fulva]|nr:MAG: hypothetical protein L6R40_002783 [Xanthomendoza cf. fulva]
MTYGYPLGHWPASDGGPPNGGIPPSIPQPSPQWFHPPRPVPEPTTSTPPEPPGALFYGKAVEAEGVRCLFPLERVVFHIVDHNFVKGSPYGQIRVWVYFPQCTILDFFRSLGVQTGVREYQYTGSQTLIPSQQILLSDPRAGKTLSEIGWVAGRGIDSKPIWIEVLG